MPYSNDSRMLFEAYSKRFVKETSKEVIKESVETDPEVIAREEDPAHDGAQVTAADHKAADYISKKRKAIEDQIKKTKSEEAEEASNKENSLHSDALYIWDYLLNKRKHSPSDAMKIVNMAKVAFEHLT
ncbi:MAG: hypothetical protein EBU90_25725 [Proteobacteria bacterium]|nr:hypothetical protein [Pseudomonadota bacterium]